jgi:asparagine synthase (glutamine-hydrolysing)
MCGIAGAWRFRPDASARAEESVAAILSTIVHRGPDDAGVWRAPGTDLVLGHRRLSIIDLSALGHQPMLSADRRTAVVFNGEIYCFRELRRELEAQGARFASESDTEVLLEGFRRWGDGVVDRLVGMFAFAIWDADRRELFLARDRAGEKPLYYASGAWGFAFSSEIAGLTKIPEVDLGQDPDALAMYLHYQYIPAPMTVYQGIRKLPPASAMRVGPGGLRTWRYWDPAPLAAGPRLEISEPEAVAELERLLVQSITGQMIADVPLGAFLSGGIDSTAVVSVMAELSSTQVRTFTIGFDVPSYDESPYALAVARHLGVNHTVEHLTQKDALELIPTIPSMFGEPFSDSSALPTHLVSRVARKHVTVALSGDGGDEAFGGYSRYDEIERILMLSNMTWPLTPIARTLLSRLPGRAGRGGRLLGLDAKEIYRARFSVYNTADVQAMTGHVPPLKEFDRAWAAASNRPVRQRAMLADLVTYLPESVLTKVDRAAMKVSLETRAPLLDHRVLEFALRLPAQFSRRKHLLKQLVYRRVPQALLDRSKMGFGVPLGHWIRADLRDMVMDLLAPARMRAVGIQDYSVVKRTLASHMSGEFDEYVRLWSLMVLSLWHAGQREKASQPALDHLAVAGAPRHAARVVAQ